MVDARLSQVNVGKDCPWSTTFLGIYRQQRACWDLFLACRGIQFMSWFWEECRWQRRPGRGSSA